MSKTTCLQRLSSTSHFILVVSNLSFELLHDSWGDGNSDPIARAQSLTRHVDRIGGIMGGSDAMSFRRRGIPVEPDSQDLRRSGSACRFWALFIAEDTTPLTH